MASPQSHSLDPDHHRRPPNAEPLQGQAPYSKAFTRCHDEDGLGDEKIARIAGQQPQHLRLAPKRYRTGSGARLNKRMAINVRQMTDANIEALIAFNMSMG